MIIVSRDGELIRQDELSQEQKESALVMVFRSFLLAHPEYLDTGGQDAAAPSTSAV